ncbi:MAG: sulfate adenylyltransferase [Alphaproteobacteria bacterium]|nr:sulfate adenylyltransferase [Alphaproteobacteria bacterium]
MSASPQLALNLLQYLELEKIGLGAFSPLDGFMDEAQFTAVVETMRLPSGAVFTLPVLLDVDTEVAAQLKTSSEVDLTYDGELVGRLFPRDFFGCDRAPVARAIFGTDDMGHPGVAHFFSLQPVFVGGRVELIKRAEVGIWHDKLTPEDARTRFAELGWKRIVGFQTRNVPHRAHEYLQRIALEWSDGLFIQPLIGQRRNGDFTPEAVLKGYGALVGDFLPADRVVLGTLSTFMRFAGPREAVFHAIIRRNYGCTHFIVGRDHAGVGNWYGKYDAHALAHQFEGDLGIEVLRLSGPYYCETCDGVATEKTCAHYGTDVAKEINGSDMRRILVDGEAPDPRLMRPEVVAALRGVPLFVGD